MAFMKIDSFEKDGFNICFKYSGAKFTILKIMILEVKIFWNWIVFLLKWVRIILLFKFDYLFFRIKMWFQISDFVQVDRNKF